MQNSTPVTDDQVKLWEEYHLAAMTYERAKMDPAMSTKAKVKLALQSVLLWRRFCDASGCPMPISGPETRPRISYPYMVWMAGEPRASLPRNRFQTISAAQAEAEEIARKKPGATVYVLEEVMRSQAPISTRTEAVPADG